MFEQGMGSATCLGKVLNLVRCGTRNMFEHGIEPCEPFGVP